MNAHKNLSRLDVVRHGAGKIALMAASEFYRAAKRSHSIESVKASFERGRELMGILETLPIPAPAARRLRVIFSCASETRLRIDFPQERIIKMANEIAYELEKPLS